MKIFRCNNCGRFLGEDQFSYRNKVKNIKNNICKRCVGTYNELYREDNRDYLLEQRRQDYLNNKDRYKANARSWRSENRDYKHHVDKQWRDNNKEYKAKLDREWYLNNIEHKKAYDIERRKEYLQRPEVRVANAQRTSERRARVREQTPTTVRQDKIDLYYKISDYLGSDWEVDHIIPIAKGGLHHEDNLQIISATDNRKKGKKLNYKVGYSFRI